MSQPLGRRLSATVSLAPVIVLTAVLYFSGWLNSPPERSQPPERFQPRLFQLDSSGYGLAVANYFPWGEKASLEEIGRCQDRVGYRTITELDSELANQNLLPSKRINARLAKAVLYNYEGEPIQAYQVLERLRSDVENDRALARDWLYTVIYLQAVTALRRGENDNCVQCRGKSACILPIAVEAVHAKPLGSRLALTHFTEYLRAFPDDLEVRWLLNLAHMTLGEYPHKVDPQFLIPQAVFTGSEFDIGKFHDVSDKVGLDRLNKAGGAILDDFDNDGLLDLVVTDWDAKRPMAFYRNKGDGTFEDRTEEPDWATNSGD